MKINNHDEHQLSLTLPVRASAAGSTRCTSRQRRLRRAGLWFQHMRQVVDQAADPVAKPVASEFSHAN